MYMYLNRSQDSSLVEHRTRDQNRQKVASSNPGTSSRRIFSSRVNFLCWLLFGIRCNPVLPQWQVKNSGHSAKSAGGRLHLNTRRVHPWPNEVGVGWLCRCPGIVWKPIRKQAHIQLVRECSSQLAEPQWTDPGIKKGIYMRELISTLKKKARQEWMIEHFPKLLASEDKAT